IGAVTPLGVTASQTWEGLVAGRSGIGTITRFDAVGTGCPVTIAGEVKGFDPVAPLSAPLFPRGRDGEPVASAFSPKDVKKLGRFTHLGAAAALEAYVDSGLDADRASLSPDRLGVNLGVGLGGLPEIEATQTHFATHGYRR